MPDRREGDLQGFLAGGTQYFTAGHVSACEGKVHCKAWHAHCWICLMCRQCSSGLQAIASVAASIQAGYYDIGLAGGVETMSTNPMAWDGGVNPKIAENQKAQDCLLPMGELLGLPDMISLSSFTSPPFDA